MLRARPIDIGVAVYQRVQASVQQNIQPLRGRMTLDLRQAADFLKMHPQSVRERAQAGNIPGASKPGKRWVFQEAGLVEYLNQHSPCPYIESEKSGTSTVSYTHLRAHETP